MFVGRIIAAILIFVGSARVILLIWVPAATVPQTLVARKTAPTSTIRIRISLIQTWKKVRWADSAFRIIALIPVPLRCRDTVPRKEQDSEPDKHCAC